MEPMPTLWLKRSMPTLPQSKPEFKEVALSSRLSAIADCLDDSAYVCDVGSDHGALPLYLLSSGKCKKAIVTDLNEKPLERARFNLFQAGVDQHATFVQTDGIEEVLPLQPDSFVIAGMGGETILGILDRALHDIAHGTFFVMQPMTKVAALRRYLYETGFFISDEKLVYENHKFFIVICATFDGVSRPEKVIFSDFGEYLPKDRSEIAKSYFSSILSSVENIIHGKKNARVNFDEDLRKRNLILKILEEMDESQRD